MSLNKRLEVIVDELIKRANELTVEAYALQPPKDLLARLSKVSEKGNAKYARALGTVRENVQKKFGSSVEQVNDLPFNVRIERIRTLTYQLVFLPDDLHQRFKHLLAEKEAQISSQKRYVATNIDEAMQADDSLEQNVRNIANMLLKYHDENMREYFELLRERVTRKLHDYFVRVEESLDKHEFATAVVDLKKILKYVDVLSTSGVQLPQLASIRTNVCQSVNKFVDVCCESLARIEQIGEVATVTKAYANIVEFVRFAAAESSDSNGGGIN